MTPYTSDPKFYAYNWKKFYSLYVLAKQLNGRLFLVNYSTRESDKNLVKLMEVLDFDYEKIKKYDLQNIRSACEYMQLKSIKLTRETFSYHLRNLNSECSMPIWMEVIRGENK